VCNTDWTTAALYSQATLNVGCKNIKLKRAKLLLVLLLLLLLHVLLLLLLLLLLIVFV